MRAAALVLAAILAAELASADVTVDTAADSDADDLHCSLREAIVAANTNADHQGCTRTAATVDKITFALTTGTPAITVSGSELPTITEPTEIDGATGGATRVAILSGGGGLQRGLTFGNGNTTASIVRTLVVSGFTSSEIFISNGNGFTLTGNWHGHDVAGTSLVAGSGSGIEICSGFSCGTSVGHTIGGASAALRNVIVGGSSSAIVVNSPGSTTIQGNFINTNAAGTQQASQTFTSGIVLNNSSSNVIKGNVVVGFNPMVITGNPALAQSNGTIVQGNFIGTDASGTVAIGPSNSDGITVAHAINTQIGGLAPGEGNLVSGYANAITGGSSGVSGAKVDDTTVQGNLIGTAANGTDALGNSGIGVALGDDAIIEGNVIAFNSGDGIQVNCGACIQKITGNSIHSNGGIGIDLNGGSDGVTPNDADDGDDGPNHRQNFPVLDPVEFPGSTSISGTLDSIASTTFRVEIFANDACDASGNGEGQELVGVKTDVTTDAQGDADFTVTLSQSVPAGTIMTATAIAPDGSASELSPCTPSPPTTTTTSTTSSTSTTVITSTTSTTAAPTTVTTSTAASPTTTTSTSTSTSSSSAAVATTTTSTSTTRAPTTTTTLGGCAPRAATFVSIDCRLDQLQADLLAATGLDDYAPKLLVNVDKATQRKLDAEATCRDGNLKKTRKRLQQSAKALAQYAHRLNGLAAKKKLDDPLRRRFLDQAAPIAADLKTLRGDVRCPEDAPPA
jgi:CSLREA domain-containing protein